MCFSHRHRSTISYGEVVTFFDQSLTVTSSDDLRHKIGVCKSRLMISKKTHSSFTSNFNTSMGVSGGLSMSRMLPWSAVGTDNFLIITMKQYQSQTDLSLKGLSIKQKELKYEPMIPPSKKIDDSKPLISRKPGS